MKENYGFSNEQEYEDYAHLMWILNNTEN